MKKIFPALLAIILIFLWVNNRKNAWFKNPTEEKYELSTAPQRLILTLGENQNERILSWQSGSAESQTLHFFAENADTICIVSEPNLVKTDGGKVYFFSAKMENLKPQTRYFYRILAQNFATDWHDFQTADDGDESSFLYFGDVQDTIGGDFKTEFATVLQRENAEFVIFGGDVIERGLEKFWAKFFTDLDTFAHQKPILAIPGNHEYRKGFDRKLDARFAGVFPYFQKFPAGENHCATFKFKNAQFFLLDSNNDFLQQFSQRNWLKTELEKSTARWKIVVLHHPIFSLRGKFTNIDTRLIFNPLFEKFGVNLVLSGHEHGYARKGEKPVYIISHFSPKNYRHTTFDDFEKYSPKEKTTVSVKISTENLELVARNLAGETVDSVGVK